MKQQVEIATPEMARILHVSRQTAWVKCQAGQIPGARLIAGKLWVAPRSRVMALARRLARRDAMLAKLQPLLEEMDARTLVERRNDDKMVSADPHSLTLTTTK